MTVTTQHQALIQKMPFPTSWQWALTGRMKGTKEKWDTACCLPRWSEHSKAHHLAQRTRVAWCETTAPAVGVSTSSHKISPGVNVAHSARPFGYTTGPYSPCPCRPGSPQAPRSHLSPSFFLPPPWRHHEASARGLLTPLPQLKQSKANDFLKNSWAMPYGQTVPSWPSRCGQQQAVCCQPRSRDQAAGRCPVPAKSPGHGHRNPQHRGEGVVNQKN